MNFEPIDGYTLYPIWRTLKEKIANMEIRNDDVFVLAYPKSGSTWSQEIVWLLANDLNFDECNGDNLPIRTQFLENNMIVGRDDVAQHVLDYYNKIYDGKDVIDYLAKKPSPRIIKTHLGWELFPKQILSGEKKPKIVFITRNIKDVMVSSYHHFSKIKCCNPDFNQHVKDVMNDHMCYGPFFKFLSGHLKHHEFSGSLILRYEDLVENFSTEVKRLANYLGKTITDEEVKALKEFVSIQKMKKQGYGREYFKGFQGFEDSCLIREGKNASYKEMIDEKTNKIIDDWIDKSLKKYRLKEEELPCYVRYKK